MYVLKCTTRMNLNFSIWIKYWLFGMNVHCVFFIQNQYTGFMQDFHLFRWNSTTQNLDKQEKTMTKTRRGWKKSSSLMSSPARATRSHGGIPGTLSPSVKRASPKSESGPPRARMRLSDTPQPTSPMPKKRKSSQSK